MRVRPLWRDECPYKRRKSHFCLCLTVPPQEHRGAALWEAGRRWLSATYGECPHRMPVLMTPWSWTSSIHNRGQIRFCCLSHLVCGVLLWYPEQRKTHTSLFLLDSAFHIFAHHRFHPGHPVSAPPSPCPPLKLSSAINLPGKLPMAKPPGTCGPPWWCWLCSTPFIHMSDRTLMTSFTWPPEQELALMLSREWGYKWMNPNTLSPKRTNRMILDKSSFMELTCKSL